MGEILGSSWALARLMVITDAARYGTSAHRAALAYVLHHPFPTAAIIGPRTMAQLEDSCAAADVALSADDVAYLLSLPRDVSECRRKGN